MNQDTAPADLEAPAPHGVKPKRWPRLRAGIRRSILVGGIAAFATVVGIVALNNWSTIASLFPKGQVVVAGSVPNVAPQAEVPASNPEPAPAPQPAPPAEPLVEAAGLTEKQRKEVEAAVQTAISQIPQPPRQEIDIAAVATQVATLVEQNLSGRFEDVFGQIGGLGGKVAAAEASVASLDNKVSNLPSQVNYQPQINALTGAVEGQATQIAGLEAGVESLNEATSTFDGLHQRLAVVEQVAEATSTQVSANSDAIGHLQQETAEMKKTLAALAAAATLTVTAPTVASAAGTYAPPQGGCSIEVSIHSNGNGYPSNTVTAWANGGQIRGVVEGAAPPAEGKIYIPVDCTFANGSQGEVCFGDQPGMARDLHPIWFEGARKNLASGQYVLNAGIPLMVLGFSED